MPREILKRRLYQMKTMMKVFENIANGDDTAITGVGSIGKSNFLRTMLLDEVQQDYLNLYLDKYKADYPDISNRNYILIYVDSHLLMHRGEIIDKAGRSFTGYELLFSKLIATLKRMKREGHWQVPVDEKHRERMLEILEDDYHDLISNSKGDSYAALRYFEEACDIFMGVFPDLHLVFLIDEVERFFHYLPIQFFEQLRGVRDDFKRQLMFVTTSRYLMSELRNSFPTDEEQEIVEGFTELFKDTEIPLPRLSREDAMKNIERYQKRYNVEDFSHVAANLLFDATGGHAGLLRHSFRAAASYPLKDAPRNEEFALEQFCEFLIKNEDSGAFKECKTVFESLSPEEQKLSIEKSIKKRDEDFEQKIRIVQRLMKKQIWYTVSVNGEEISRALPIFDMFLELHHRGK